MENQRVLPIAAGGDAGWNWLSWRQMLGLDPILGGTESTAKATPKPPPNVRGMLNGIRGGRYAANEHTRGRHSKGTS
jgi:hypothetical protein